MNESKNFVHLVVHFMKWSVDFFVHFTKWTNILSISQNGQLSCPFHEMDNFLVHFTKWTILHLGHNTYISNSKIQLKFHIASEINVFLHIMQKFKGAAKNGRRTFFLKKG